MSQPRIDIRAVAPDSNRGFRQAGRDAQENGIEPALKHLIDTRVSQINGCAFCLEMHVREAKHGGETDDRLHLVAVWHDGQQFDDIGKRGGNWRGLWRGGDGTRRGRDNAFTTSPSASLHAVDGSAPTLVGSRA